jgi:hypothetical protein
LALLIAAGVALAVKISLALNTYGSNDVITWEAHLAKIKADGVRTWYRDGVRVFDSAGHLVGTQLANHPPFTVKVLLAWDYLAHYTGLPMRFWLRLTASVADTGSLLLLWKLRASSGVRLSPAILILLALSPISIMISGFHGNTDSIVAFLMLMAIWLVETRQSCWRAGGALGMAINIKVIPLILIPVFFFYLGTLRRRTELLLAVTAALFAGFMPYLVEDPTLILHSVFGYNPESAAWGVSQLAFVFMPARIYSVYLLVGKALAFSLVLMACVRMNRESGRQVLFLQCGYILFLFLFFTPGFGVQYLAWVVPWSAGVTGRSIPLFYYSSTAFLFTVYTVWSGGVPWFYANGFSHSAPFWTGLLVFLLEITCWISVGSIAYSLAKRSAGGIGGTSCTNG